MFLRRIYTLCLLALPMTSSAVSQVPLADVGALAPRVVMRATDGTVLDSRSLDGKVYVVDFWSPHCGPCRGAVTGLNAVHQRLASSGGGPVLGLMTGASTQEDIEDAVREWGIDFPVGTRFMSGQADESAAYGVRRLPATFVVGSNGRIAASFEQMPSDAQLMEAVVAALNAHP